jgi:hypothetical protein
MVVRLVVRLGGTLVEPLGEMRSVDKLGHYWVMQMEIN